MEKKSEWFKTKKVTAFFAIIAFLGGFIFLDGNLTGSVTLENQPLFKLLPFMGLLLVICSVILAGYSIKK